MGFTTFAFEIDEHLKARFEALARAQGRDAADLVSEFIAASVDKNRADAEYEAWFLAEVQKGIDEADAGLGIPDEEVEAHFALWREGLRDKITKAS